MPGKNWRILKYISTSETNESTTWVGVMIGRRRRRFTVESLLSGFMLPSYRGCEPGHVGIEHFCRRSRPHLWWSNPLTGVPAPFFELRYDSIT